MKVKEILLCILCGILISAFATGFHYFRGRYIVRDMCEYLYPGDTYIEDVGKIDLVKAEKWVGVRYQVIGEDNGILMLYPDWNGIKFEFCVLSTWYSILSIIVCLILKRTKLFRKK